MDIAKKLAALLRADPQSTVGQLSDADAYRRYVIEAQQNGQQPVSFQEYQQQKAVNYGS